MTVRFQTFTDYFLPGLQASQGSKLGETTQSHFLSGGDVWVNSIQIFATASISRKSFVLVALWSSGGV